MPHPVVAREETVFIDEIAWMGTPVAGVEEKQWWRYEWLELYNPGDTAVTLDNWKIELWRDKLDFTVSLAGTIVPNGYYIAGASEKIPNLDLNYKNLGGKLNNSGQRIVLKNTVGEVIDEVDARNGWPAGDNTTKQTMERMNSGWQTSKDSGGTPKAPNSAGPIEAELSPTQFEAELSRTKEDKDETEKDLARSSFSSSPLASSQPQSFQSRAPVINPITLLAGFLALGFSGALLVLKRSLASRQERQRS